MGDMFIVGAGLSKEVHCAMPILRELSQKVSQISKATAASPFPDNFELSLTYLAQSHPWLPEAENLRNRATFLELSDAVARVVDDCVNMATKTECPDWLTSLVRSWHASQASVVTLNYDTLVERAAARGWPNGMGHVKLDCSNLYPVPLARAQYRTGPVGIFDNDEPQTTYSTFRLIKLHGSSNWFYSGRSDFRGETIYYAPVYDWRTTWTQHDTWDQQNQEAVSDKVPLIVPPVTDKIPYFGHETVRSLWAGAATALRQADRIYCIGYSLPETDLTMRFLLQSRQDDRAVPFYPVNSASDAFAHYKSLLPTNRYEVIPYFTPVETAGVSPIHKLVEALA